jgi:hypothetical protein
MSNENVKVPLTIELRAGDVLVAVSENVGLWGGVLVEILKEIPPHEMGLSGEQE